MPATMGTCLSECRKISDCAENLGFRLPIVLSTDEMIPEYRRESQFQVNLECGQFTPTPVGAQLPLFFHLIVTPEGYKPRSNKFTFAIECHLHGRTILTGKCKR